MSTTRKRLQLRSESVRNLNPEELGDVEGGILVPKSWGDVGCTVPPHPHPWPLPWPVGPKPTPPNVLHANAGHARRSANGFCAGI
jgi:hypothetical protein